jgi:hypothetical protein
MPDNGISYAKIALDDNNNKKAKKRKEKIYLSELPKTDLNATYR